ncbi:MAG: allantoate amidohydrolase [Planctomycetes bacterium]|nr:allantoate amidohydrolase [Planctomycetota bacterium]
MCAKTLSSHPNAFPADASVGVTALGLCDDLAGCSDDADRLTRVFLGEGMKAAHHLLAQWSDERGLSCRIDAAGNFIARRPAASDNAPVLLIGSHLDTVPNAGRYDGALGIVIGFAAVEQLGDIPLPFHVDVVAFSEEEGVRYRLSYIGSSALAGTFDPAWLDRVDDAGVAMHEAIASYGLNPGAIADAVYDRARLIGYIEAHIEQGPVLESLGQPVGIVSAIAGQSRLRLSFHGRAAHAGTTPMADRADALVAASRFIAAASDMSQSDPDLRVTIGRIDNLPNATNVIPETTTISLDVRHPLDAAREAAMTRLIDEARRLASAARVTFTIDESRSQAAVKMDDRLRACLAAAAKSAGCEAPVLPSGAGHDAVPMAALGPVSMLFVRHPGGVSHHPSERVEAGDVAVAIDVIVRCIGRIAEEHTRKPQP